MPPDFAYRRATQDDTLCLSVLATQVFLDTYATKGINIDLAKEARAVYSPEVFTTRLADRTVEITVAHCGEYLVGFIDMNDNARCPVASIEGLEVLRLYVQAPFQRCGVGKRLMAIAEQRALAKSRAFVWLTAWSGNAQALAFYPSVGYADVGTTSYVIEGKAYQNRVFAKRLATNAA